MISLEEYKKAIFENFYIMSRTAHGVIDLSSSESKKESMLINDGEKAKDLAITNYEKAIEFIYSNKNKIFKNEDEIKHFIESIALIVNEGIVQKNKLYRNGSEAIRYKYVQIKDIPSTMNKLCSILLSLFNDNNYDPIKAAAISEFYINMRGHFFSDGCGKTSMIMASYCLMRKDIKIRSYKSRDLYYKSEPLTFDNDEEDVKRFTNYYYSLYSD